MKELRPGYAVDDHGVVHVDPDVAYPEILAALGVEAIDQYWLEVAYQCAKLEAQQLAAQPDSVLMIRIASRKERWALANFPEGRGVAAATEGREAKVHFDTWQRLQARQRAGR